MIIDEVGSGSGGKPLATAATGKAPGARMLRGAWPLILLIIVLNWLLATAAVRGLYPQALLAPLQMLVTGTLLLLIFRRATRMVDADHRSGLHIAAELSEAQSLLAALSNSTTDAVLASDREGELVFVNQAALEMLDTTREQAMGRPVKELFTSGGDADMERSALEDRRVMEENISVTGEYSLQLPRGMATFSIIRSPWLGPDNRVLGVIAVGTDISRQKEVADALRTRELQLEETVSRRTVALRRLADHLETVREEEKRAIARELHDDMGA